MISKLNTYPPIKLLIIAICAITLLVSILDPLFMRTLNWGSLSYALSLSWSGMQHWYLWQLVTHPFLYPGYQMGITFGLLINLAFTNYLLWIFGTTVMEYTGLKSFLRFFFGTAIFSGLLTVGILGLFANTALFSGPLPIVMAILFFWTMLSPEAELLFFFLIPIKAKKLMVWILALVFLMDSSQGDIVELIRTIFAVVFAYGYGLYAWRLKSPFEWTHSFDESVIQFFAPGAKSSKTKETEESDASARIVDFNTGETLKNDDEVFVDSMLDKISRQGEKSLTAAEKQRLQDISDKRNRR